MLAWNPTSTLHACRAILLWLALAGTAVGCSTTDEQEEEAWLPPRAAPPIHATAVRANTPFELTDVRGHVAMLSFGYTSCADICPTTLATMRGVLQHLGKDADSVRALYVSVDPERDTPDVFRHFLDAFDPRIEGLSLSGAPLAEMMGAYGIVATRRPTNLRRYVGREIDPAADYSMDHTAGLWLVDPEGKLRVRYRHDISSERIARGVARLLHE